MDARYEQIVKAAIAAPSGDNSQPWRFVFRKPNVLEFHAIQEKDNAALNVDGSGTFIALGAAIENACLEATSLGFAPRVEYSNAGTLAATLVLNAGGECPEPERMLAKSIPHRHSNRKAYAKKQLLPDDRKAFVEAAENAHASLTLIEEPETMAAISRALTTMEEIALSNQTLHRLFFSSIFWSHERNEAGEHGLYIKTLELPPPAQLFFRALRHWGVAKVLARIRFPALVAETNAKQNASASAFGIISLTRHERTGYIEAGRLLERVWLMAVARGMSLQIVTGILFLARAVERGAEFLSAEECVAVRAAYARIRKDSNTDEPFLIFRVGYADAPSAVSFRKAPVIDTAP